jgi:hypothetical protein
MLMISTGQRAAMASAAAVLPLAVGPTKAKASGWTVGAVINARA